MENLDTLDLQEVKSLCKKYGIGTVGDKKSLIKKLKYFLDPIQDVLNTHTGRKIPKEKEMETFVFCVITFEPIID